VHINPAFSAFISIAARALSLVLVPVLKARQPWGEVWVVVQKLVYPAGAHDLVQLLGVQVVICAQVWWLVR
jgi:hypothetical protein